MLEEKGGWIFGEVPTSYEEMMDVKIENMAQGSKLEAEGKLNSFREQPSEILPKDVERNHSGFLVRKNAISFKVDDLKLGNHITFLKDQILIAKFMGPKPYQKVMHK